MGGSWTAVNVSYAKFDGAFFETLRILIGSDYGGRTGKIRLERKKRLKEKKYDMGGCGCNMSFDVKCMVFSERAYFLEEMGWKVFSVMVVIVMLYDLKRFFSAFLRHKTRKYGDFV